MSWQEKEALPGPERRKAINKHFSELRCENSNEIDAKSKKHRQLSGNLHIESKRNLLSLECKRFIAFVVSMAGGRREKKWVEESEEN
jgi:hypothetical protein